MSDLDQHEAFIAVARNRSFSRAASVLGISRSYVSRQVAALEARLGVRLLSRTTRQVTLTPAGEVLLSATEGLFDGVAEAEAQLQEQEALVAGAVHLSIPNAFGDRFVIPLLVEFQQLYPEVVLHVDSTDRKLDLVAEGIDLAIRGGKLEDSAMVSRRLWPYERLLVTSPAYLARCGKPQTPADLAQHACLIYTGNNPPDRWTFQHNDAESVTVAVEGPMRSNSPTALVAAAAAGHGITLQPDFITGCRIRSGELVTILDEWKSEGGGLHAILPRREHMPLRLRVLVDFLTKAWETQPWRAPHRQPSDSSPPHRSLTAPSKAPHRS